MGWRLFPVAALALALVAAPGHAAPALTLYSAQHEQVIDMLTGAFTRSTGIVVKAHEGEGPELAAQLIQEGRDSPADIFFTENSPELTLLDEQGLLAPVDPATLQLIPAKYSAADHNWIGVLARENVLSYDPKLISEAQLPAALLDLAKPAWKNRIAIAPSDADFLPLVSAVIKQAGQPAAMAWLQGLKANARIYQDDEAVVAAVDRGAVPAGITNNYYWYRLRTAQGAAATASRIYHFKNQDVGAVVNISGAAVLKSSPNQAAAQKFLAFLVSAPAQHLLADTDIDFEYPLAAGVAPNKQLPPFASLQPPAIDVSGLGDDKAAGALLQAAGLI